MSLNSVAGFAARFPEQVTMAYRQSEEYLATEPHLQETVRLTRRFCHTILLQLVPSYFESQARIGYFPFAEASTDGAFAIDLALSGLYKPAYSCLRSFLELSFVGLHYLALPDRDRSGVKWLEGESSTPFRSRVVRALQAHPQFSAAAKKVDLFGRFDSLYGRLSDITHTKGLDYGHIKISKANFPRFVDSSLREFSQAAHEAASLVATAFSILRPVVLIPLPLFEKFGLNPPASGFLEGSEVEDVMSLLPSGHREWLGSRGDSDEEARSVLAWILELPDLSEEEIQKQVEDQEKWLTELSETDEHVESSGGGEDEGR